MKAWGVVFVAGRGSPPQKYVAFNEIRLMLQARNSQLKWLNSIDIQSCFSRIIPDHFLIFFWLVVSLRCGFFNLSLPFIQHKWCPPRCEYVMRTTGELFVKSWYHLLGLSFSPRFGTEANGNPSSVSWSGRLDMVHVVHIREGIWVGKNELGIQN